MSSFLMHGSKIHITLNHTGNDTVKSDKNFSTAFRVGGVVYDFPNTQLDDAIELFDQIALSEIDKGLSLPPVIFCVYSTYRNYCLIDWQRIEQNARNKSERINEIEVWNLN